MHASFVFQNLIKSLLNEAPRSRECRFEMTFCDIHWNCDCVLQPVGFVTFRSHAAAEAAKKDLQVVYLYLPPYAAF